MPRAFLRYSSRVLRGLTTQYRSWGPNLSGECLQLFTSINAAVEGSAVKMEHFEKLVTNVERIVSHTYASAGFGDADRAITEREILVTGKIPQVMIPMLENLLGNLIPDLKKDVDRLALYFLDYSWLNMSDDAKTVAFRRTLTLDVFKKVKMKRDGSGNGGLVRRCTRCCEFSEDTGVSREYPQWLVSMIKSCVCGSMFRIEATRVSRD
jgi:hypothetical protein